MTTDPVTVALTHANLLRLETIGQRYTNLTRDPSNWAARQRQALIRQAIHVARQLES